MRFALIICVLCATVAAHEDCYKGLSRSVSVVVQSSSEFRRVVLVSFDVPLCILVAALGSVIVQIEEEVGSMDSETSKETTTTLQNLEQLFKAYKVHPKTQQQLDVTASFYNNEYLDFWFASNSLDAPSTVMVYPEVESEFTQSLKNANISHSLFIEDVGSFLKSERRNRKSPEKVEDGQISLTTYNGYSTIEKYIKRLAKEYPDIVTLEAIGKTYEKREMWLIKIGKGGKNKPVFFIDGGIHAREWISPAVVIYTIYSLVENKNNRHLIENVDWYIIPVLNPDGYEYSRNTCAGWRKNRAPTDVPICRGVDLNRNFAYHWGKEGPMNSTCSDQYAGERPADQLETINVQNVVLKYKEHIKLYLSFHSYGPYILLPWGYTPAKPKNHAELSQLAVHVRDAIFAVQGTRYKIGAPRDLVGYVASGGSYDWVKGVGGVDMSYVIELPGWGFFPPEAMIFGTCAETFEGTKVFHNYIEKKFVTN